MRTLSALALFAGLATPAAGQWIQSVTLSSAPNGFSNTPVDLNDDGTLLVQYSFAFSIAHNAHPMLWTKAGGTRNLSSDVNDVRVGCLSGDSKYTFAYQSLGNPFRMPIVFENSSGTYVKSPNLGVVAAASNTDGSEYYGFANTDPLTPVVVQRVAASMTTLPTLPLPGLVTQNAQVAAANADGSMLAGNIVYVNGSSQVVKTRALRWDRSQPPVTAQFLAVPAGFDSTSAAAAATALPRWVGAAWTDPNPHVPVVFDGNQATPLPLPPGDLFGDALGISASGATIVGGSRASGFSDLGRVWCDTLKLSGRSIESLLLSRGIDIHEWTNFNLKLISPSGQYVAGTARFTDNFTYIWVAFVGQTCCLADIDDNGVVDLSDFFAFFNCWDLGGPCADLDADPDVNLSDFFAFFNAFDAGC